MLACARCGVRSQTVGESRCTVCKAPLCAYCTVLGNRACAAHVGAHRGVGQGIPAARLAPLPIQETLRDGGSELPAGPVPADAVRVALALPQPLAVRHPAGVEDETPLSPAAPEVTGGTVQDGDVLTRWPWRSVLEAESCLTRFEAAARSCPRITYDLQGRRAALRLDAHPWERSAEEVDIKGFGRVLTLTIRREMRVHRASSAFPAPFVVEMRACVGERDETEPAQATLLRGLLAPLHAAEAGFHYLVLFSPCGWCDEAREMVQKEIGSGILLKSAKIVLVGPGTEGAHVNRGDVRARELDELLPPMTYAERQAALMQGIEVLRKGRKGLELQEVVDVYGCQSDEVLKAFKALQANGIGRVIRTGWGGVMLLWSD